MFHGRFGTVCLRLVLTKQTQPWHPSPWDDHPVITLFRGGFEAAGGIEDSLQHCFDPSYSSARGLGLRCAVLGLGGSRRLQDIDLNAISMALWHGDIRGNTSARAAWEGGLDYNPRGARPGLSLLPSQFANSNS